VTHKLLKDLDMPVTLGKVIGRDASGGAYAMELYVDGPDGIVKARVTDPDPVTAPPPDLPAAGLSVR
jgi:hypothetical protein